MERSVNTLAILGGKPAFDEKLFVGRPNVGDRTRLLERINNLLDKKWFSNNGPYVQEFERQLADMLGVKHCIATCNATVALEITIRAIGLTGEVILPSFTFIATSHSLQWQEITPVFCDVDPGTHNIDPARVEDLITPRTSGIIGVHLWGRPCNVDALKDLAQRRGLWLMFDAAHALGCSYKGQMVGSFGNAEVFSFHATKFCNSFEGGAIATNSDELADKIRLMKNFGFAGFDNVIYIGTNGKMSEICAAMGITSLENIEHFVEANRRNYELYKQALADIPGVTLIDYDSSEKCNYQYVVLEIDEDITKISRDQLVRVLHAENIVARRYFFPGCHRMEPYRSYFPHAGLLLPQTERLASRVLLLPTGTSIGADEVLGICEIVRCAVANGVQIRDKLLGELVDFDTKQKEPRGHI